MIAIEAYRHLVHGDIDEARRLAVSALTTPKKIWGGDDWRFHCRAARGRCDDRKGKAQRAVDFLERLAPEYARYKTRKDIDPRDFCAGAGSSEERLFIVPCPLFP